MSPKGRPEGEYRSAQREGTPVSAEPATSARASSAPRPEWTTRRERGSVRMIRLMTRLSLLLGRRASRGIVYGIAA